MITKEELQDIMQQNNAVDAIYNILSEQNAHICKLEDELNAVAKAASEI